VSRVRPYGRNPRLIGDRAVEMVSRSLAEFGWQQPLVVDRDGVLVVGHTRLLAAIRLGMGRVPVVVADLSDEQAAAYRIADNRTSDYTDWDVGKLLAELDELAGSGLEDVLGLADWQQVIAGQADESLDLELSSSAAEQFARLELTVVCGSAEARRTVEAMLAGLDGVLDVRRS